MQIKNAHLKRWAFFLKVLVWIGLINWIGWIGLKGSMSSKSSKKLLTKQTKHQAPNNFPLWGIEGASTKL